MNVFQIMRSLSLLAAFLLLMMMPWQAHMESSIVGSWSGTIKAGEFSFNASVNFSEGGTFSIKAGVLSSSGSYFATETSITLMPSSPPGFSATTMSLSFSEEGNRAFLSGTINGLQGTLSIKRRITALMKNPLYAVWQTEVDDSLITLELYESGWVFWHEDYEKGANTRLLQQIRQGILEGELEDTAAILALIEGMSHFLVSGGKLVLTGNELVIYPLEQPNNNPAAPAFWMSAWDEVASSWRFQTEIIKRQLHLHAGENEYFFIRLTDSISFPEHEMFAPYLELKQ